MLYGKYQFLCRLENEAILPYYKGSTFRGVFGHAMKKVVCVLKRQECRQCLLNQRCVYTLVFETSDFTKPPEGSKIASVPHPFVIEPPLMTQTHFAEGSAFDFHLILFGEVNHNLPYFIYAFDQMGKLGIGRRIKGKRGQFALDTVKVNGQVIYSNDDQTLKTSDPLHSLNLSEPKDCPEETFRLRLVLETPLRFKFGNRLMADLPFHVLVRVMLRRISALFNCYGAGELPLDYQGLVRRAEAVRMADSTLEWFDWRRYSQRQERGMLMGGVMGSVTYEGKIGEYMPLIDFCTKVHLGKQTSFGLGKVRFEKI